MNAAAPLLLIPQRSRSAHLAATVKALAHEHGLTVATITSADPFPELEPLLHERIAAGHLDGLDWFTPERATFSTAPRNLQ
jgi:epoxyqueuosine reductase